MKLPSIESWNKEIVNKQVLAYYMMSGMREYCIRLSVVSDSLQYVCSVSDLSQGTKHILDADGIELDIPLITHHGYPTLNYAIDVCEKHNKQASFLLNGHH